MPLVSARDFNLNPVRDISPLANAIESAFIDQRKIQESRRLEQIELNRQALKTTGAQFAGLRDLNDLSAQRKELAKLGQAALKRGEDITPYEEGLSINDPDEMNLFLSRIITRATDADTLLNERAKAQYAPEEQGFTLKPGDVRFDKNGIQIAEGAKEPENEGYQQGTGAMSGYAFNEKTGEYILNDVAKKALEKDALKLAGKDTQLSPKDVAGINDKVTGLTKGVTDIAEAGKALDALESRSTAAAKLAAVFKFMKAMDPSSTVRESEQGQVYSAEGLMKGFANQINAALGKGGLSEAGFRDLTNTAKALANSAIDSSAQNVRGYLDVLSDKVTARDFNKLLARVPQKLELSPEIEGEPVNSEPTTVDDLDKLTLEELIQLRQRQAGQ